MGSCSDHAHSLYVSFRRLIKGQASSGDETKSAYGSTVNLTQENASSSRTLSSDYTELMGGSVPCPSCKGSGRIPKEMEETLVALIPVNDDRLKPKRTWAYVLCGILVCILLAGGAIFLMVPRAVDLSSVRPPIEIINVFDHDADHISFYFLVFVSAEGETGAFPISFEERVLWMNKLQIPPAAVAFKRTAFLFENAINISNANYYSVRVVNSSATIISKFQPWSSDVVGEGGNASSTMVGPRSRNKHLLEFNNTVTLKGGVAEYCQAPFSRLTSLYVNMQFDISVTLEYLSHREQATISTVQQVCCVPSGNCTST